jgi:hypothetical protein
MSQLQFTVEFYLHVLGTKMQVFYLSNIHGAHIYHNHMLSPIPSSSEVYVQFWMECATEIEELEKRCYKFEGYHESSKVIFLKCLLLQLYYRLGLSYQVLFLSHHPHW